MSFDPSTPAEPSATPAGWYPDNGQQRYWDGTAWTEHVAPAAGGLVAQPAYGGPGQAMAMSPSQALAVAPTADERTMAALAHALGIFAGFLGPLIIMLVKGDQSVYVKHHAVEALNFAITVTIAAMVSALLVIVLIGLLLLPVVLVGALALHIMAAIAANKGEWYRYPVTLRLIPGPIPV